MSRLRTSTHGSSSRPRADPTGTSLDIDIEAARVVTEAADARHLARPGPLAGHALDDTGDHAALERAQGAADRRHPRAGHTFVNIDWSCEEVSVGTLMTPILRLTQSSRKSSRRFSPSLA